MSNENLYSLGVKNVMYSFFAQGLAFITSLIIGFILPKVMGINQYGYWQIYLFYTSYIMLLSLGFNDGLYLRYGNLDYNQLPFEKLRGTMRIFNVILIIISIVMFFFTFYEKDYNKAFAFRTIILNITIMGINGTLLIILQFTNRIKLNSVITILNKIVFILIIIPFLFLNWVDFRFIIAADIFTKIILLIVNMYKSKELFVGESKNIKTSIIEYWENIRVGSKLTFAIIMDMAIVGIGRFYVERFMPIEKYSLYSFATTITLFTLTFINAASLALYPLLKRLSEEKFPVFYINLNKLLNTILFLFLSTYYPFYYLIKLHFSEFVGVLDYLNVLFILLFFQGKTTFLINTFYKVLREEKAMMFANISGFLLSLALVTSIFFIYHSVMGIIIATLIAQFIRCYYSEIYLKNKMGIKGNINIFVELLINIIFIISFMWGISVYGFIFYLCIVSIYALNNKYILKSYVTKIFNLAFVK